VIEWIPLGLKPESLGALYAALKRRSSTVLRAMALKRRSSTVLRGIEDRIQVEVY
jgi:hypothetical protein